MVIDQIRVSGAVDQGLKGVTDSARDEDGGLRTHVQGEASAEAVTGPQIDPCTEDPAHRQRDQLVPRLGVNPSSSTSGGVERHIVLDRSEVRQSELYHLAALPVLLEPAAAVSPDIERDDQQAGNRCRGDGQFTHRHYWPWRA